MMFARILAQARLVALGGFRRKALLGLFLFSLGVTLVGLFFVQFIPKDLGRAAADYFFSVVWGTGILFMLFYVVPSAAWGEERSFLPVYLARPLSRSEYVVGLFLGMALLLLALHVILGCINWGMLLFIRQYYNGAYFSLLSLPFFVVASLGLYLIHLELLAIILFLTSAVRGSFPVLLCSICYYFICNGLPVVRESLASQAAEKGDLITTLYAWLMPLLSAIFPDASRLNFKSLVTTLDPAPAFTHITLSFGLAILYITLIVALTCFVYERRDLQ